MNHSTTPTFSKPASVSILNRLPAELTTEICDLATLNCRPNAANARLACQYLHTYSSPFLVRTIVIAARLEALRKARDVLGHPYFSKHVTRLLWDASYYRPELADQRESYDREFARGCHTLGLADPDFCALQYADDMLEDELRSIEPRALSEQGSPSAEEIIRRLASDDQYRRVYLVEGAFMRGSHRSHPDYLFRWIRQENICTTKVNPIRLESKRLDVDGNLARYYFLKAVDELPLLSHISYSDFRSLAFEGESYKDLCRRLFGRTVSPSVEFMHSPYHEQISVQLLSDLSERQKSCLTLSIGRHPFEGSHIDASDPGSREHDILQEVMEVSHDPFGDLKSLDHLKLRVRSLRLPLLGGNVSALKDMVGLTRILGADLVDIDIGTQSFRRLSKMRQPENLESACDGAFWHLPALLTLDLTAVRSISLRGFAFDIAALQNLLFSCAVTLRTLRLADCFCCGSYEAFQDSAKPEVSQLLTLTGVEIYGLLFKDSIYRYKEHHKKRHSMIYRAMRYRQPIFYSSTAEKMPGPRIWTAGELEAKGRSEGVDLISGWPYERPELEEAMLGGHANGIVRRMSSPLNEDACEKWWDQPVSYK